MTAFHDNISLTTEGSISNEQLRALVEIQTKSEITDDDRQTAARIIEQLDAKVNGVPIRDYIARVGNEDIDLLAAMKIRPDAELTDTTSNLRIGPLIVVAAVVVITGIPGDSPRHKTSSA